MLLLLNGLWDLYSSLAILSNLPDLHTPLLKTNALSRKLLGAWVFSYGAARFLAGLTQSRGALRLAFLSYLQEGLFWYTQGHSSLGLLCYIMGYLGGEGLLT